MHLSRPWDSRDPDIRLLEVAGDRLVVWDRESNPSNSAFFLFDISDPYHPVQIGVQSSVYAVQNTGVSDIEIVGDLLYVTGADSGQPSFRVHDLTLFTPGYGGVALLDQLIVGQNGSFSGVGVVGSYAYCSRLGANPGVTAVDVSDPTDLEVVGGYDGQPSQDQLAYDERGYLIGASVLGLDDPASPGQVAGLGGVCDPNAVVLIGRRVFSATKDDLFHVHDLNDLLHPRPVSYSVSPSLELQDFDARGGLLFMLTGTASGTPRPRSLVVLDVSGCVGCPADLAEPYGLLDLSDINAFASGFVAQQSLADLNGDGLFDLSDIGDFVDGFVSGCSD